MVQDFLQGVSIFSENPNEGQVALIAIIITLAVGLAGLFITIRAQIISAKENFKSKIVYEGWVSIQKYLFNYSESLIEFDSYLSSLVIDLKMLDGHPTFIKRNWLKTANDLAPLWHGIASSFVEMLRAYEGHEIFFNKLEKMKANLSKEHSKFSEIYMNFIFDIPLDIENKVFSKEFRKNWIKQINLLIDASAQMHAFVLMDFRNELQNVAFGSLLNRRLAKRRADKGYKILTIDGFRTVK